MFIRQSNTRRIPNGKVYTKYVLKGYAYTVVERREREKDYPLEWEEGFTLIGEEANGVYVKRVVICPQK